MGEMKSGKVFTVIKNSLRRKPSSLAWVGEDSHQPKEHGEAYQNTYSNFAVKSNSTQQISRESPEEVKESTTMKTMKDIFYQYCSDATIHGVKNLRPTTNKIRRFLYFVNVLLLSGFLFSLLIEILILYASNPYKTNYYALVRKTMEFPTVTTCNVESMFQDDKQYGDNETLMSQFKETIPHSINVVQCFYNNESCHEIKPTIIIIRGQLYGCYTIRASINRTFDVDIVDNGEGLFVDLLTTRSRLTGEKGVQVYIHEDKTEPSQMSSSFFAGPKDATFAVIQPEKVIKLGTPYHAPDEDCQNDASPTYKNPLKFYEFYSVANCQRECIGLYIVENCNCKIPFFPGNARECTFGDYYDCISKHLQICLSQTTYINRCQCTPNCSFLRYESRISVTRMRYGGDQPRTELAELTGKNRKEKEDMFRIRIYFENMVMKYLEENPRFKLDELLVYFGGQMGLFLGASVISAYEFLEMVFMILWSLLTSMFRKSEVPFKRTPAIRKKNVNKQRKSWN